MYNGMLGNWGNLINSSNIHRAEKDNEFLFHFKKHKNFKLFSDQKLVQFTKITSINLFSVEECAQIVQHNFLYKIQFVKLTDLTHTKKYPKKTLRLLSYLITDIVSDANLKKNFFLCCAGREWVQHLSKHNFFN